MSKKQIIGRGLSMLYLKEAEMRKAIIKHFKFKRDENENEILNTMITPIETRETVRGVPDLHIRSRYLDWFVEHKTVPANVRASTAIKVPFRPGQIMWMETHHNLRGNVALILHTNRTYHFIMQMVNINSMYVSRNDLMESSDWYGELEDIPVDIWDNARRVR